MRSTSFSRGATSVSTDRGRTNAAAKQQTCSPEVPDLAEDGCAGVSKGSQGLRALSQTIFAGSVLPRSVASCWGNKYWSPTNGVHICTTSFHRQWASLMPVATAVGTLRNASFGASGQHCKAGLPTRNFRKYICLRKLVEFAEFP